MALEDKRVQQMLLQMMSALNFVIIIFLSMTIGLTAERIAKSGQARAFFDRISAVPYSPRLLPLFAVSLFLLLLAVMALAQRPGAEPRKQHTCAAAAVVLVLALLGLLRLS